MTASEFRIGCFPGSFDPLTVAHVAIAEAAHDQCGLTRLDLVLSRVALGKEHAGQTPVAARVSDITARTSHLGWLDAIATDQQLVTDIAAGYDVVVMGADKWDQLHDPSFYGSAEEMRAALGRLPTVAIAARRGHRLPAAGADHEIVVLDVDLAYRDVSATAVRNGCDRWRA